jgi:putative transposase
MEARQRHYKNRVGPSQLGFFTFTALDFAHHFRRPEMREEMTRSFLEDVASKHARLHAFVVMTHHVHFVARMPLDMDGSRFVQCAKRNSAKRMMPMLSESEVKALSQQTGLNRRTFWKRGFRSLPILNHRVLAQKVDYIHANPVRAELCESAIDYRWSSAWLWEEERFAGEEYELDVFAVLEEFSGRS